jgi:hypothetical protein
VLDNTLPRAVDRLAATLHGLTCSNAALVAAARALLHAHDSGADTGANRNAAFETLRAALAPFRET